MDNDILEMVNGTMRARKIPFHDAPNNLSREALLHDDKTPRRTLEVRPVHMGYNAGLNHDDIGALLEYGEGEQHR